MTTINFELQFISSNSKLQVTRISISYMYANFLLVLAYGWSFHGVMNNYIAYNTHVCKRAPFTGWSHQALYIVHVHVHHRHLNHILKVCTHQTSLFMDCRIDGLDSQIQTGTHKFNKIQNKVQSRSIKYRSQTHSCLFTWLVNTIKEFKGTE